MGIWGNGVLNVIVGINTVAKEEDMSQVLISID
ncbi:hypothetical protein PC116_g32131 [Phytophthora cactorum]|nr:hypothetical protein PC116_g32131 [Phytophthora cactorum]